MRKILLCIILGFSINTYGQVKKPVLKSEAEAYGSSKVHIMGNRLQRGKSYSISSVFNPEKIFRQSAENASSSTPIYDDIYVWQRDIPGKKWVFDNRTINLVYNVNSDLLSFVTQKWNGSAWVNDQQVTYSFTSGNLTGELWQKWNGTTWLNDYNYIKSFNANNYITTESGLLWNGTSWVNDYQSLYSYNSDNNLIKFTQQIWDGSLWTDSYQEISTYNNDKNLATKMSQFWDGSAWTNSFRDTYSYNADKNITGILEESFAPGDIWENYSQITYSYDANKNVINELKQTWGGSSWDNYSNFSYIYDEHNNQKSKTGQEWVGSSWVQASLHANTFDVNNFLVSETNRSWTNNVLTSGDSTFYNVHTVITAINDATEEILTLYPNPGPGKFTIKSNKFLGKIDIYNMGGEKIYSDAKENQKNSVEIDLLNYAKGIYLLKVSFGDRIINRKVIIK